MFTPVIKPTPLALADSETGSVQEDVDSILGTLEERFFFLFDLRLSSDKDEPEYLEICFLLSTLQLSFGLELLVRDFEDDVGLEGISQIKTVKVARIACCSVDFLVSIRFYTASLLSKLFLPKGASMVIPTELAFSYSFLATELSKLDTLFEVSLTSFSPHIPGRIISTKYAHPTSKTVLDMIKINILLRLHGCPMENYASVFKSLRVLSLPSIDQSTEQKQSQSPNPPEKPQYFKIFELDPSEVTYLIGAKGSRITNLRKRYKSDVKVLQSQEPGYKTQYVRVVSQDKETFHKCVEKIEKELKIFRQVYDAL